MALKDIVQVYCMITQPFPLLMGISAHGISISFAIPKHGGRGVLIEGNLSEGEENTFTFASHSWGTVLHDHSILD